ncbi:MULTISPECIES: hypothetical protein [Sphingobium]|uniref:hypothetical protein n=1 Tax=Sphingobium TaxID=165695 RepID=UPI00159C2513|nr:hypothetical protein [Sphingobium sp. 15-1]
MLASTAMVKVFGQAQSNLSGLALAAAAGFFTNAGVAALYFIIALCFPISVRGGSTGVVIGIALGGAVLGSIIHGFLFSLNQWKS